MKIMSRGIRTRMWFALGAALGAAMVSGCSSVPVSQREGRGLFQKGPVYDSKAGSPVEVPPGLARNADSGFVWPIAEGKITSAFGKRRRDFHEGIDIRAARGTPVRAVRDGEVIYSSRQIKGYGNMIVIKHEGGWASVYAHNKSNSVIVGNHVKQGQVVGYVGATGKATGPHLHFEIRKDELPKDPLLFLPQVRTSTVSVR